MTTMSDHPHGGVSFKSYEAFLQMELRDRELAAAYLTAALAGGSTEEFLLALRSVLHALGLDLAFTPAASTT
jgi:hypothetical protein